MRRQNRWFAPKPGPKLQFEVKVEKVTDYAQIARLELSRRLASSSTAKSSMLADCRIKYTSRSGWLRERTCVSPRAYAAFDRETILCNYATHKYPIKRYGAADRSVRVVRVELGLDEPHSIGLIGFPLTASIVIGATAIVAFVVGFSSASFGMGWRERPI